MKLANITLSLLFTFALCTTASYASVPLHLSVDGQIVDLTNTLAQPYIDDANRTMVPVRFVSEALGARVTWNETSQSVYIQSTSTDQPTTMTLTINSSNVIVDGVTKSMDTRAVLKDSFTMVPLRFIAENLGSQVTWEPHLNRVQIASKTFQVLKPYTLLIYMNGSDLESAIDEQTGIPAGSASQDIEELIQGFAQQTGQNPASINVIIETGGTKEWLNPLISPNVQQRFSVTKQGLIEVAQLNPSNMGSSDTLANFLKWGIQTYPAKRYGLILWNHGGGPIVGFGVDEWFDGDALLLAELKDALQTTKNVTNKLFDFIGFDACLMASLETATTLSPFADYMVASQELEPGHGWDYNALVSSILQNPSQTTHDMLVVLANGFRKQAIDHETDADITLSVTTLNRLPSLIGATEEFFDVLRRKISTIEGITFIAKQIVQAKSFGGNTEDQGYTNLVDLIDFAQLSLGTSSPTYTRLKTALNNAVTYKISGPIHKTASGLSLFLPYWAPADFDWQLDIYNNLALPQNIAGFTKDLANLITDSQNSEDIYFNVSAADATSGNYTLNVDGYSQQLVNNVYLSVYLYTSQGRPRYRGLGFDALIEYADDGTYISNFYSAWTLLQGHAVTLNIVEDNGDMITYEIPMKLNGQPVNLIATWTYDDSKAAGGYYVIIGARKAINLTNNMPTRDLIKVKAGDKIELKYTSFFIDTQTYSDEYGPAFTLDTGFSLDYLDLPNESFLIQFLIYDYSGNVLTSDFLYF